MGLIFVINFIIATSFSKFGLDVANFMQIVIEQSSRKASRTFSIVAGAGILIYSLYFLVLLPDKRKKDSDKKIREMAIDIVNELLKSGEHMNADIGIETGDIIAKKCPGPVNYVCPTEDFRCTKFSCNVKDQFICLGKFTGARDFAFSV